MGSHAYEARLKTLFQRPKLFVLAGGINPIGNEAFYMSGGNTSAHQLGWPEFGTSMRDMVDHARKIVLTVEIPVFAMRSVPRRLRVLGVSPAMAAFSTSRVCAPMEEFYLPD